MKPATHFTIITMNSLEKLGAYPRNLPGTHNIDVRILKHPTDD